jgi:tRNA pseudouridine38-40 synthase
VTELTRYKMIVEYRGTNFSGWQRQKDVPSIQQAVEEAIKAFSGQDVTIHVAGRTDAGVHAFGQVIHVDLAPFSKPMDGFEIAKAINYHLKPAPIAIIDTQIVNGDFNARFDAVNKLYRYRIVARPSPLAIEEGLAWRSYRTLDHNAMHEGAQYLLGNHDFTSFRDSECQAKSPVRTLDRLDVTARPYDHIGGVEVHIEAEAQSFLHHQMRNITGTLHMVGEGKLKPADIKTILEARDRTAAGPTAPPDGLYLVRVDYTA